MASTTASILSFSQILMCSMPRVLQKTIGSLVAGEFDEADLIDEQSRALARRHRHVEQVAVARQLRQNGFQLLAENFQPRDFRAPQIGEDARLRGAVDLGVGAERPTGW